MACKALYSLTSTLYYEVKRLREENEKLTKLKESAKP